MQQRNNKKYKINAREWYLPGYQQTLARTIFRFSSLRNHLNQKTEIGYRSNCYWIKLVVLVHV
jgi:hypothetical protein